MNHPGKYLISLCMITAIIINTAYGMTKSPRHNNIGVIIVDIQGDFVNLPVINPRTLQKTSPTLAVNTPEYGNTNENYIKAAQKFTDDMRAYNMPIFFTQDWHPKDPISHVSFASTWKDKGYKNIELFNPFPDADFPLQPEDEKYKVEGQVMWPDHCIQGSPGARILLKVQPQDTVIQKGANPYVESYSGFEDKDGTKTPLTSELHKPGVTDVIVFGIATDFCVNFTALDALKDGFGVHLVINLSRGVDANLIAQKIEDLITFGANVYYINGLNDGWTPSAATKETLKKFGVIECTNVADFLNKVHLHIRKGKAVSKIPSIEKESLLAKELARSFAGKLPSPKELKRGKQVLSEVTFENLESLARNTITKESEKLRFVLEKVQEKDKKNIKKEIEKFIQNTTNMLKDKISNKAIETNEPDIIKNAFEEFRNSLWRYIPEEETKVEASSTKKEPVFKGMSKEEWESAISSLDEENKRAAETGTIKKTYIH